MVLLTGDAVFPGDPLAGQSSSGRGVILLDGLGPNLDLLGTSISNIGGMWNSIYWVLSGFYSYI